MGYNTLSEDGTENVTRDMVVAALNALKTMTEPVVLNLIEDKYKYQAVYKQMMQDEDREGIEMIEDYMKDVVEKQDCFDWKIRQSETDLIKLMSDATLAHELLQKYALDISIDPVISGIFIYYHLLILF